jgi:DNA excision repair protein ERCC-6
VSFLKSEAMTAIMNRTKNMLYGISVLRKICNHPDLLDPHLKAKPGYAWGDESKSGKMAVVKCLLLKWKREGHKTLLFCQGSQMLNILEAFVKGLADMRYLRMDGSTPIKDRQVLVDKFNNSRDLVLSSTTLIGIRLPTFRRESEPGGSDRQRT